MTIFGLYKWQETITWMGCRIIFVLTVRSLFTSGRDFVIFPHKGEPVPHVIIECTRCSVIVKVVFSAHENLKISDRNVILTWTSLVSQNVVHQLRHSYHGLVRKSETFGIANYRGRTSP